MSQTLRSLFIITVLSIAGAMLISLTVPAAFYPTMIVLAFTVGILCIAAAVMEAIMLYDRLAGTFTRFRAKLQKTGDMT